MKEKIEPRLLDIQHLDRELAILFASIRHGHGGDTISKYKQRFVEEQEEKKNPDAMPRKSRQGILSVGKKLEILCTYGDYEIVKIDKKQQP